jgi:hypothetical protein
MPDVLYGQPGMAWNLVKVLCSDILWIAAGHIVMLGAKMGAWSQDLAINARLERDGMRRRLG